MTQDQIMKADPGATQSYWLRHAAAHGDLNVVHSLLDDGRSDPNALNGSALRLAARFGHGAIVRRLLRDRRTDPGLAASEALRSACEYGHLDIVDALLQDGRSDIDAVQSSALIKAAHNDHVHVLRRLLPQRPHPTLQRVANAALRVALARGRHGAARALVEYADDADLTGEARRQLNAYRVRALRALVLARRGPWFARLPMALQSRIAEMAFGAVFDGVHDLQLDLDRMEIRSSP